MSDAAEVRLEPGLRLQDRHIPDRIVELVQRTDPWGVDVTPTWRVRNVATGHESIVQESNLSRHYTALSEPTA